MKSVTGCDKILVTKYIKLKQTYCGNAPIFAVPASQVPPKHSYGMLFCSCPPHDQSACSERRRQTIVPVCSYDEKQKPNCLELQGSCKTNYICR